MFNDKNLDYMIAILAKSWIMHPQVTVLDLEIVNFL